MPAEPIVASPVVTVAAAEALGDVFGVGEPQPTRDQVREEVRQAVQQAVQGARQGATDAGRAAVDAQRLTEELRRAQEAVAQIAPPSTGGNLSITRDGNNVIIHTPDGRMITLDQTIVPPPAIEGLVTSLGGPPPMPPPAFPNDGPPENVMRFATLALVCFTLIVISTALARAFGRRAMARAASASAVPPDLALRLERIEQAVDAMAVEMERVSEAQRYSARLLTERLPGGWQPLPEAQAAHRAGQNTP